MKAIPRFVRHAALSGLLLLCVLPTGLQAQGTSASLAVRVTTAGNPVPGALVTVRDTATGFVTSGGTGPTGQVVFQQLPLGSSYSITAERIGLRTLTRAGYALALGRRVSAELALEPAAVAIAPLTVQASAELPPARIGGNTRIDAETMAALPTAGRNFTDLAALSPTAAADFSLGGQRSTSTDIRIDGLQARNMLRGGELGRGPYTLSMEAIREFEIVTNQYDVTQGRQGGGSVIAATKSGTNRFEGSVFGFYRDDALSASTDYLGRGREYRDLRLLQWGGSVGGAFIPDKLHYFASFDRQNSKEPLAIGDLRTERDQIDAGVAADSLVRFVNILKAKYGLPADMGTGIFERKPVANTLFARIDWQASAKHRITLRNNWSSLDGPNNGYGDQIIALLESRSSATSSDNQTLLSMRSSMGSVQNELRLGLSLASRELKTNTNIPRGFVRVRSALPNGTQGDVRLQFGGNRLAPEESSEQQIQLVNTTYWQRGSHLLTFGMDHSLTYLQTFIPTDEYGLFQFNSLADLDNLNPASYARQVPIESEQPHSRQSVLDLGFFAQTEWRPTSSLTATFGVRWDVTSYRTAAAGNALLEQKLGLRTDNTPTDMDNVQPRAQLVWESTSVGTVRVGGGLFTTQPHYYLQANNIFFSGTHLADLSLTGAATPKPNFPAYRANLSSVPGVPAGTTPPAYVNLISDSFSNPTVRKVSAAWDRSFMSGALRTSVTGLYARTFDNYQYFDRNLKDEPAFRLDNEASREVFVPANTITATGATNVRNAVKATEFTNVLELVSNGQAQQKTLIFEATVRPSFGGLVRFGYTWNRTKDYSTFNCCIARTASLLTPVAGDPRDLSDSWGPTDYDFKNKVVGYGELPEVFGFTLGARYTGSTGRTFSVTVNGDINGDGYSGNDLAFVFDPDDPATPADVAASMRKLLANEQSIASDYLRANLGRIAERNGGNAPWSQRLDVRVARGVGVGGGRSIEWTADIFNFLNLLNSDWGGQVILPQGISLSNPTTQQLQLLNVVGFDQATRRYRYTVNENLGVFQKRGDPFQIQVGGRLRF